MKAVQPTTTTRREALLSIANWVKQYQEATFEEKVAKGKKEAAKKALFGFIDMEHGEGAKGGVEEDGFQAIREVRTTSEVREDALIGLLCEKEGTDPLAFRTWLESCVTAAGMAVPGVKITLAVDEDSVKGLMESETITQDEFMGCVTVKEVPAIRVKEVTANV